MTDLMQTIVRLQGYLPSLENLAMVISWIIGLLLVVRAILNAGRRSDLGKQAGGWGGPIGGFLAGCAFIALPSLITVMSITIFEEAPSNASSIFAYAPATIGLFDDGGPARQILTAISAVAMFVGLLAVMRGIYMLNLASQGGNGQATYGSGMTFLIAGILAVNFPKFVGLFEQLVVAGN